MINRLKDFYTRSPIIIKKIYGLVPNKIKYGRTYRYWTRVIENKDDLERNPFETLKYAINKFSFYKQLYKGVDLSDWSKIPLLDKKTIQNHLTEFENNSINKIYVNTGGVIGAPSKFYQSNNVWFKEMAFLYSFFLKSGYKPPNLKVSFRGADFSKLNDNDYWINNPHHYEINFSPFHLSELTVKSYVKKLNELKPKFLHGYPSAFISLAKHIQESGLNLNFKPKCIFLISEGYDLKDINFIKEFFKTNISSFYGLSERVVFAVADSNLENYIVDTNYGYFELIDSSGNIIETENVTGEIVATSYDNYAMPLIRYKTGDFTSYVNFKNKIFRKISGKWGQEFLYGVNKEEISLTALNLHSEQLDDVLKLQFIQHGLGDIEVLIMFKSQKDRLFISGIESFLSKRVGNKIRFNLNQTNNFIKTHRGKIPMIISKLEIK